MNEAEVQQVEDGAVEGADAAVEDGQQAKDTRDYETEARELGWRPQEEFNGEEGRWKDAKTFVEDGERVLPIVRSQLKRTREELAAKDAEHAEAIKRMQQATAAVIKRQKAQYEDEMATIKAQQREAAASGDVEEFSRLETRREALEKSAPTDDFDEKPENPQDVQAEWISRNSWYVDDFELAQDAMKYSQWLASQPNAPSMKVNLERTEAHIREKHPEKFGGKPKPKQNGHAAVDGGSLFPGGKREKGFDQLPADAKAAYEEFVASGVDMKKEDYAKEYWNG